jgi:hypothetical protein
MPGLAVYDATIGKGITKGWQCMQHPFAACSTGMALRASFPREKGAVARGAFASPYRSGQRSLNPFVMAGSAIHQQAIRLLISEYSYTVPSRALGSNKIQAIFSCSRFSATTRIR